MPAAEYVTSIWISMKAEYVYPGDRVLESGTSASPVRWLQAINPSTSSKMLETHEQKKGNSHFWKYKEKLNKS
jgi:hypothetical protein